MCPPLHLLPLISVPETHLEVSGPIVVNVMASVSFVNVGARLGFEALYLRFVEN